MDELEYEQLKESLEELIEDSPSLNEMPEEERALRIESMRSAPPEKLKQIIQVLEEEKAYFEDVEKEFEESADDVHEYYVEVKGNKNKQEREELAKVENKEQAKTEKEASNLMSKLEEAVEEKEKSIEKTAKKKPNVVREAVAAMIGCFMSGLAGILIIFLMILPMETYERLDVAFSLKPLLFYPAYWVAVIFSAILGLIVVPFLRLIKTKSFILSIFLGGIMGGVVVGLVHMATGLQYDIIIMQDFNPTGIRGYWIAVIFSVLIGFFAQLINRVINKVGFFKIADE